LQRVVPCNCGRRRPAAWAEEFIRCEEYCDTGSFDEDGIINWREKGRKGPEHLESLGETTECGACSRKGSHEGELIEIAEVQPGDSDSDVRYTVQCSGCLKQLDFGWTEPQRGGRLVPAGTKDFKLSSLHPDPQHEKRETKGCWLDVDAKAPRKPKRRKR